MNYDYKILKVTRHIYETNIMNYYNFCYSKCTMLPLQDVLCQLPEPIIVFTITYNHITIVTSSTVPFWKMINRCSEK